MPLSKDLIFNYLNCVKAVAEFYDDGEKLPMNDHVVYRQTPLYLHSYKKVTFAAKKYICGRLSLRVVYECKKMHSIYNKNK